MRQAEKRAQRSQKGLEYLGKPFIKETVRHRMEGLAEWMLTSLDIIEKSLEDVVTDEEPTIHAAEVWELVVRSYAKYERKYRKSGSHSDIKSGDPGRGLGVIKGRPVGDEGRLRVP